MVSRRSSPKLVDLPVTGVTVALVLAAARRGEAWAQEELYRRHVHRVSGLVYRLAPRYEAIDDLVQDVFVVAFTSLDRLQDPELLDAWLRGIAVRLVARCIRRDRLLRRLGLAVDAPFDLGSAVSRSASPEVVLELRRVYRLIESLSAQERIALVLKRVEGLTHEQIASSLGVSIPTAKRRVASAERALAVLDSEGSP